MTEPPPVSSVWLTCQQPARDQRRGRYVPETSSHPAKMLPAIAAHAVIAYSRPGDLVLDPMCGSGTTLVEAVRHGREALGVDVEPRFTALAEANLALAREQGATAWSQVVRGDATRLPDIVPPSARKHVALVLTSPPYGGRTHGLVRARAGEGVHKRDFRYGSGGNLAYAGWSGLLDGFRKILVGCMAMLRPDGTVVVTCRPVRRRPDDLFDLPGALVDVAVSVGLEPVERCAALLVALRGDQVVHRASLFQLMAVRRARAAGLPVHVLAHEDVLVFRLLEPDGPVPA